jgi:hypothetical protein
VCVRCGGAAAALCRCAASGALQLKGGMRLDSMTIEAQNMDADDAPMVVVGVASKRRRSTDVPGAAPLQRQVGAQGKFKTPRRAPPVRKGALSVQEKESILRCICSLRNEKLFERGGGGRMKPCPPQETIARLFGVATSTVKELCSVYEQTGVVPGGIGTGNSQYSHKLSLDAVYGHTRLKQVIELACIESAANDVRMTYHQMVRVAKEKLPEDPDHPITYHAMRRWAKRNGYIWTSHLRSRKMTLATTEKAQAAAAMYCRKFVDIGGRPVIYQDESYINQYHSSRFAVANASIPDTMPHATKKGKRLCFATAIAKHVGELKECRWIFCPDKTEAKKADYHASFNRTNFLEWFTSKLIPAISSSFPDQPCVIVLDNAAYHVAGTAETTVDGVVKKVTKQSSKTTLAQWVNEHSDRNLTPGDVDRMFKTELVSIYQAVLLSLGNDIERIARSHNHTVLFTPPRKSEWQPIEKFWAVVKNDVAQKYTKTRTFPQVRSQLELAMDKFGGGSADASDTCSKIIAKVEQSIRLYHDTLRQADIRAQQRLEELAVNPLFHISSSDADDWGYSDSSDAASCISVE